ncbi:MAG: HAMP domain-containing protein [Candidatus Omnitrophica bacterium]|nr:HAMP domain-containing protein [Candidatus Omnitrophota bacterium]
MGNFKNFRITTKFIIWFLLISLVPLVAAIVVSYRSSRTVLEEIVKNSLLAVADDKANRVEAFFQKVKNDAVNLSLTSEFIDAAEKFSNTFQGNGARSPEYKALALELVPMLRYYQKLSGYSDIIFISSDGEVTFSVSNSQEIESLYEAVLNNRKSELAETFIKAKESGEIEISNVEQRSGSAEGAIFIVIPVTKQATRVGFVAFEVGNKGVYEFVQDYSNLGDTGETIIAAGINEEAVFIAPTRFEPDAAFKKKIKIKSREAREIAAALGGKQGAGLSTDYRGRSVLAVWRPLPTFRLGMIVKIDAKEVFTAAEKLRNSLIRISVVLIVVVVIIAIFLARSISRPIKNLTNTSKIISGGELSARVNINTKDEIGELAVSFNQMTDKLLEAKANVEKKNKEIEEQKRLLEESSKELDSFVYTASHDLRAPLRGIEGLVKFIEEDYADKFDTQGNDYLKRIRIGVTRMKQLIDDLLTLSRISRIKNPFEDVAMGELVSSVISRVEFDITQHNIELAVARNMPAVRCDRIKMQEVFFNLISNAIKFSSKNKDVRPKVEVGYHDKSDAYEFYVKDNGIGIDKKHHNEIFGIFKRLHTQEEYEGTGAGLSIVKRIIDDHKGQIWLESGLGKGAAFYFTIPKNIPEKMTATRVADDDGVSKDGAPGALTKPENDEMSA